MTAQKNTMNYMSLEYGTNWDVKIDLSDDANKAFDAIDLHFEGDKDWEETASSETYWGGTIELNDQVYWIASEFDVNCGDGIVFLVSKNN